MGDLAMGGDWDNSGFRRGDIGSGTSHGLAGTARAAQTRVNFFSATPGGGTSDRPGDHDDHHHLTYSITYPIEYNHDDHR